jgi:excisionase family DNA binding protein
LSLAADREVIPMSVATLNTATLTTPICDAAALLDVNGVAALLNCSPRHVYRLSDAGKMPRPLKLGALIRWPRQSVLDWIGSGCKPVRAH